MNNPEALQAQIDRIFNTLEDIQRRLYKLEQRRDTEYDVMQLQSDIRSLQSDVRQVQNDNRFR
jgi:peptidoglycan hydrolase CwlO-like protein